MQERSSRRNNADKLLTPKQAAEALCVTAQTVKKYIYSGRLPSVKTPGGHHRVRESDVRALLQPSEFTQEEERLDLHPHLEIIRSLVGIIEELRDTFEPGHGERVARRARSLAANLGLSSEEQEQIWIGGLLHDVGKLRLDPDVLRKEGRLTRSERSHVKQHSIYGGEILGDVRQLQGLSDMVRHHHERLDGNGYPDGLEGDEIPLAAQIIAIAEAYDSMLSRAAYREPLPTDDAVEEVLSGRGTFYDERLTDAFVATLD